MYKQIDAELLAKELYEVLGSCPADFKDWEPPFDCNLQCTVGEEWQCWIEWASENVERRRGNERRITTMLVYTDGRQIDEGRMELFNRRIKERRNVLQP